MFAVQSVSMFSSPIFFPAISIVSKTTQLVYEDVEGDIGHVIVPAIAMSLSLRKCALHL